MTTITIAGKAFNLVTLPASPAPADMMLGMMDSVATVESPYVPSVTQQYAWPGADRWYGQFTLPPLSNSQAAEWEGFLSELQGTLNVFQIGDPRRQAPLGPALGIPVTQSGNTAMSNQLLTTGWTPSVARILLRGDMLQVGYRLYRVTETVSSDGSGNLTLPIWPSLREDPGGAAPVILSAPKGLFRLAGNQRQAQFSLTQLTRISVQFVEAR